MTMIKQLIPAVLSVCAAAFLSAACQSSTLENQETAPVSKRVTVPFSLKVDTEATKVSYEEDVYQFKQGDKLHVVGITRTDIEGYLEKDGNMWSGNLSYSSSAGDPEKDTDLEVTLVHADNDNTDSYASAIVGGVSEGTLLQYAVEHYSLFTTQITFGTKSATLRQYATFLDVTVTFDFDGTHTTDGGKAMVDLITTRGKTTEKTDFIAAENGEDFNVHFMAVIPGGNSAQAFSLTVGDREIKFKEDGKILERNKKYTVNRSIEFRPQLGDPYWSDGLYGRFQHADPNAQIVGIIVYVNHNYEDPDKAAVDDAITEKANGYGHCLVMALKNAAEGVKWSESTTATELCTGVKITKPAQTIAAANLSGLKNTDAILTKPEGTVSAASRAKAYNVSVPESTTGWFLPSIGQWIYTISSDGFGGAAPADQWTNSPTSAEQSPKNWLKNGSLSDLVRVMSNDGSDENLLVKSLNDRLEVLKKDFGCSYDSFGMPAEGNISDNYWASSEGSASDAFRMNLGSVTKDLNDGTKYSTIKAKPQSKESTVFPYNGVNYPAKVRPFLAF